MDCRAALAMTRSLTRHRESPESGPIPHTDLEPVHGKERSDAAIAMTEIDCTGSWFVCGSGTELETRDGRPNAAEAGVHSSPVKIADYPDSRTSRSFA